MTEGTPRATTTAELFRHVHLFDFASKPRTRGAWLVRMSVTLIALWFAVRKTNAIVMPLLTARPPSPIPSEELDDYRFKLPERTRREIFAELATAELAERQRAITSNTWLGHKWSREDDRGHYERVKVRELAGRYRVSLTQIYLVLDEGIRNKWPGPDGEPLPATTPPFDPRSTW